MRRVPAHRRMDWRPRGRGDRLEPTIWPLAPHTRAKHEILREYLNAWYPKLGSWSGRINFIDGFAGPGRYSDGEPGSPIIAVETLLNHTAFTSGRLSGQFNFMFVEQRPDRFEQLQQTVAAVAARTPNNVKVHAMKTDFVAAADHLLGSLKGRILAPTLALVDPFGFSNVPLDAIRRLLSAPRCEVLFNFMMESVYRFAGKGTDADHHFEALFGTTEYNQAPPVGLERQQFLIDLYMRQLRDQCAFKFVREFEMINDRGRTGNYLVFGTRHELGLDAMKQAMWKVDPVRGRRFSDQEDGLLSLFGNEPDLDALAEQIMQRFGGTTATIETVEQFVRVETDYLPSSHLKSKTLKPLERDGHIVRVEGRRTHGYPAGCRITFTL